MKIDVNEFYERIQDLSLKHNRRQLIPVIPFMFNLSSQTFLSIWVRSCKYNRQLSEIFIFRSINSRLKYYSLEPYLSRTEEFYHKHQSYAYWFCSRMKNRKIHPDSSKVCLITCPERTCININFIDNVYRVSISTL